MTTNRIFILILVVFSCAVYVSGQTGMVKRVITKTDKLDFGAGGTVAIMGAPKGSIRVEAAEKNEIEINAEITIEAPNESDLATLESVTTFILDEAIARQAI